MATASPERRDPIVELLRTARVNAGLSQNDVAKRMGLGPGCGSSVSDYENGSTDPRLSTLRRWAESLGHEVGLTPIDVTGVTFEEVAGPGFEPGTCGV